MEIVAITGATGFLGSSMIRQMVAHHSAYKVRAIVRDQEKARRVLPYGSEIVEGDIMDLDSLKRAFAGASIVVHLAAEMDFFPKDPSEVYRINVEGTRNVIQAASALSIKRLIYSSSVIAMGPSIKGTASTEDQPLNPEYDYGKSKVEAEKLVKESQIPYVILRPTGIYGPDDRFVIFELIEMVDMGIFFFIPGDGKARLAFTYVDDVASAFIIALSTKKINQTYIISSDESPTIEEWLVTIATALKRITPKIYLPMPLCKLGITVLRPIMNRGKRRTFMYEPETLDRMLEDHSYSNEKAKRELGWKPQMSTIEGVQKTVDHYFKVGALEWSSLSTIGDALLLLTCFCGLHLLLKYLGF